MKAGRELDSLIHEKVFGQDPRQEPYQRPDGAMVYPFVPEYSTDIAAAWQVVEKLTEGEFHLSRCYGGGWECELGAPYISFGETAPLAICLAALEAVGAL